MKIISVLREVNSFNAYKTVSKYLPKKIENTDFIFNNSITIILKKLQCFEIKYFDEENENGAAFKLFDKIVNLPASKSWSYLSQQLLSVLQYWVQEVGRHLNSSNSSNWWNFLKDLLKFMKVMRLKDHFLSYLIIQSTAKYLLELVNNQSLNCFQKYEILNCFNIASVQVSRNVRRTMKPILESSIVQMASIIPSTGHHPTQFAILETLLRWLTERQSPDVKQAAAFKYFPRHLYQEAAVDVFLKNEWKYFFMDSRSFLNLINQQSQLVVSFACKKFSIYNLPMLSSLESHVHWLDLNLSSKCATILLDLRQIQLPNEEKDAWVVITIVDNDVSSLKMYKESKEAFVSILATRPPQVYPPVDLGPETGYEIRICLAPTVDLKTVDKALRDIFGFKYQSQLNAEKLPATEQQVAQEGFMAFRSRSQLNAEKLPATERPRQVAQEGFMAFRSRCQLNAQKLPATEWQVAQDGFMALRSRSQLNPEELSTTERQVPQEGFMAVRSPSQLNAEELPATKRQCAQEGFMAFRRRNNVRHSSKIKPSEEQEIHGGSDSLQMKFSSALTKNLNQRQEIPAVKFKKNKLHAITEESEIETSSRNIMFLDQKHHKARTISTRNSKKVLVNKSNTLCRREDNIEKEIKRGVPNISVSDSNTQVEPLIMDKEHEAENIADLFIQDANVIPSQNILGCNAFETNTNSQDTTKIGKELVGNTQRFHSKSQYHKKRRSKSTAPRTKKSNKKITNNTDNFITFRTKNKPEIKDIDCDIVLSPTHGSNLKNSMSETHISCSQPLYDENKNIFPKKYLNRVINTACENVCDDKQTKLKENMGKNNEQNIKVVLNQNQLSRGKNNKKSKFCENLHNPKESRSETSDLKNKSDISFSNYCDEREKKLNSMFDQLRYSTVYNNAPDLTKDKSVEDIYNFNSDTHNEDEKMRSNIIEPLNTSFVLENQEDTYKPTKRKFGVEILPEMEPISEFHSNKVNTLSSQLSIPDMNLNDENSVRTIGDIPIRSHRRSSKGLTEDSLKNKLSIASLSSPIEIRESSLKAVSSSQILLQKRKSHNNSKSNIVGEKINLNKIETNIIDKNVSYQSRISPTKFEELPRKTRQNVKSKIEAAINIDSGAKPKKTIPQEESTIESKIIKRKSTVSRSDDKKRKKESEKSLSDACSLTEWFRRNETASETAGKDPVTATCDAAKECVHWVLERANTMLDNIHQTTNTKYKKLILKATEEFKKQGTELVNRTLQQFQSNFENLHEQFNNDMKQELCDALREDFRAKTSMVHILKEDVDAVWNHIEKLKKKHERQD